MRRYEQMVVAAFLTEAGYSQRQIQQGLDYAAQHTDDSAGYDEIAQLAVSRIVYHDEQLERGALLPWMGVEDWTHYEREADRQELAQRLARELADDLGVELGRVAYTYAETGQSAAWHIKGRSTRIAVNVEQLGGEAPYAIIEDGLPEDPEYIHHFSRQTVGEDTQWIQTDAQGNPLL